MFKLGHIIFKKMQDALRNLTAMGPQFVAYFPATGADDRKIKSAYLRQYVQNRGKLIGEYDDAPTGGARPGLQEAKELCAAQGATLIIVKLDQRGRGSVLLFTPPAAAQDATAPATRTWAPLGQPQLAAAS